MCLSCQPACLYSVHALRGQVLINLKALLESEADVPPGELRPSGVVAKSRMCDKWAVHVLVQSMMTMHVVTVCNLCRVYRRLESIPTSHDEEEEKVAAELAELLGPERMPWLQLVHQLIVSEEVMQAEQ